MIQWFNDFLHKNSTSEFVFKFALFLFFILLPLSIMYFWNETLTFSRTIAHEKFGTFGDFFGGVVGSIWSLCGIILFYLALKEQRKDIRLNKESLDKQKESLDKQIAALELQGDEFKLQRDEMIETRKVFIAQNKTFLLQKFDTTFFSLINLLNQTKDSLNNNKIDYFKEFKNDVESYLNTTYYEKDDNIFKDITDSHKLCVEGYKKKLVDKAEKITNYFKVFYRILKIIEDSNFSDLEKNQYVKILRTQLNENELIILYYHSHTIYGQAFYKYILKYNLLKHCPLLSKLEFIFFIKKTKIANLYYINYNIYKKLFYFINNFSFEEEEYRSSFNLDKTNDSLFISYIMETQNKLQILITDSSQEEILEIFNIEISIFIDYFKNFLYDIFLYSRYQEEINIKIDSNHNEVSFMITSDKKLSLNYDLEKR